MPYTVAWNEASPLGSDPANTLHTIIQNKQIAIRERLAGIFGLTALEWAADPIVPKTLSLSVSVSSPSFIGNLTGSVVTPAQTNITSLGTLTSLSVSGALTASLRVLTDSIRAIGGVGITFENNAGTTLFSLAAGSGNGVFIGTVTGTSFIGNLTGTVLTAVQGNITSLGTLTSLTVTGAIVTGSSRTYNGGTTGVGVAVPTTIYALNNAKLCYLAIAGDNGAGKTFLDLIAVDGVNGFVTPIIQTGLVGVASARTYSIAGLNVQLSMSAAATTVKVLPVEFV